MPAALAGPLARIRSVLSTISLGQKVVIGLLAAGLILGGFFFYNWITAPTLSPLFSNLASTDASAIVDELNAEGVSYTLADGGSTIMVPNDQVYNLRLTMSGKGLPAGQDTGYSLLDQQGITTSEFQQQVTYQRAVEGELAKTLEAIKGVNTAVVHIALPKDQVFVQDQGKPTASVLLDLAAGTNLSGEQISAVTNLVSSSIEGMDPKDVTVADSNGQVLSAAGQVSAAAGDQRSALETDYENRLAANAQKILDQVLGPNHAVVSVRADLDLSQRQSTSETYSYNQGTPPISSSQSSETYSGTGGAVGGVLGPENTGTTGGSGNSSYNKSDTTDNNAVDKTTTTTQDAPGTIKRMTVSVVMDGTVAGNLNQQQVQSLIGNAVGLDTSRGDAITVAAMPFDTTAAQQAQAEVQAAKKAEQQAQMWSLVKTGGIALGILLVILIVWLRSRRRGEVEEEYEPLELSDDMLAELERLRVSSTRDEPIVDTAALELEAAERQRVRSEISTMVAEKPDEVAAMLRGWLSESKSGASA
ncbi:flagellar basal-body MS-ring/collar protein FliF [Petropleomorpha daqingensis]|uniref:Flagellar M-ring protein n=1 Tax=Petropleomorpha daqingensis TaxID=2026353 RepID=A0A853CEA1_9ACTN|nr:flagellar basal-body MS-ring/collar protein FliF [Petropleomorpha daqingensis]NYJ06335.1 flagellar M-ring protein FliF [Petropleomorpha daqingensis]